MKDFRKIESELIAALDASGIEVKRDQGDAFAVVAEFNECANPDLCSMEIRKGKLLCDLCEMHGNVAPRMTRIDVTAMAKRLCEL